MPEVAVAQNTTLVASNDYFRPSALCLPATTSLQYPELHNQPAAQGHPRLDNRRGNATRGNRSTYYNATSHHNHVDVYRIQDGIDVRTTV
jgi:hypothetical protein